MRPTKLTTALLDAFRTVLADELAAIAFTEEELVWQANQHLPIQEQITYRTFQRYKADIMGAEAGMDGKQEAHSDDVNEVEHQTNAENTELVRQMYITLKSALFKQKRALVHGVMEGLPNWRRYSWMLERKFPDFRLNTIKTPDTKANEPPKEEPAPTIAKAERKTLKAWLAGDKRTAAPLHEFTEMECMEYKWSQYSTHVSPWKQAINFYQFHLTPERLRRIEEEMADDEAKGFVNPYASLGYQPATCPDGVDYNNYEDGWYTFYTMGTDTPRLPIRLWSPRQIEPRDTPSTAEKEIIWAKQEWQRQHPDEQYLNEHGEPENIDVFVRKQPHNTLVKNDPWDGEPRPMHSPDQPSYGNGHIWGRSG